MSIEQEIHSEDHASSTEPGTLGRIIIIICVFGGFWMVNTLQQSHNLPTPAWATTLMLAVVGLLVGGSSVVTPEKGGAKAATYVGFVSMAIAILMMFNGWFFHMAGK